MYKNLKQLRENLKMTQKEFASSLSLGVTTYNGYETGARDPKSDFWVAVAKKYGVTIDYLMGYSNDPHKTFDEIKNTPSLSDEALKVAEDYNGLDKHGKTVVRVVMSEEQKRIKEEMARRKSKPPHQDYDDEFGEPVEPRVIPLYFTPAAAGYASPAFGEDFEYIDIEGDIPAFADFAVRIDGDSMEPYIMDGSIVYINRDPLENGDVGIFYLNGDMLCKQYYRDNDGDVHLLSLNRNRSDADRYIPVDGGVSMTCFGRVILPFRPKIALE